MTGLTCRRLIACALLALAAGCGGRGGLSPDGGQAGNGGNGGNSGGAGGGGVDGAGDRDGPGGADAVDARDAGADARSACMPSTGLRGSFPRHADSNIPTKTRFLFDIASWPTAPLKAAYKLQYGDTDIPGTFELLFALGPIGGPHVHYLYQFRPASPPLAADLPYHHFLTYRVAGATKDTTGSAVFTLKAGADDVPPVFGGIDGIDLVRVSPSDPLLAGDDCVLGEGTFVVAKVTFPMSEIKDISPSESRRDGVLFTAYESPDGIAVGKKVTARSAIWPAEYATTPTDVSLVVDVNPPSGSKRCFVVRATDTAGNEDTNTRVECVMVPP